VRHRARQVGVAGPRPRDLLGGRAGLRGANRHRGLRVLPVAVGDLQGDGSAEGGAPADAAEDADLVTLDLHAPAPSVAALAALQVTADIAFGERPPRRDAVADGDDCLT